MKNNRQKFILFLWFIFYAVVSYATDSSSIQPIPNPTPMHRTSHIEVANAIPRSVSYTSDGSQILDKCPADHSLVDIQNASKQVYWGPPAAICNQWGDCSGFGCYCWGSPHSCCVWCDIPCTGYTQVRWQGRPSSNQPTAISENMPAVLSGAGCAPLKTVWEAVT